MKALVAAALATLAISAHAEGGLRLEGGAGACRYGKAQDGTWWKNGYPTETKLDTNCLSAGLSWAPFPTPGGRLGLRVALHDFGTAKADTFVPARDADANHYPTGAACDQTTFKDCVGHYQQWGRARGISIGPLIEKDTALATVGFEAGALFYSSYWRVNGTIPGPGTCPTCTQPPFQFDWNGAAGHHTTWYLGGTLEHRGLFLRIRWYRSMSASQAQLNPENIGLISGPLSEVMLGFQLPL